MQHSPQFNPRDPHEAHSNNGHPELSVRIAHQTIDHLQQHRERSIEWLVRQMLRKERICEDTIDERMILNRCLRNKINTNNSIKRRHWPVPRSPESCVRQIGCEAKRDDVCK